MRVSKEQPKPQPTKGIISVQSFYCRKKRRIVSPGECHDCFEKMSWAEKLGFGNNRTVCIRRNGREVSFRSHSDLESGYGDWL